MRCWQEYQPTNDVYLGIFVVYSLMRRAINESNPRDKCGPISLSNTAS